MKAEKALVWFRRDLRDHDHTALAAALSGGGPVWCAFVYDTDILAALPRRNDRRVDFIHQSLHQLDQALRTRGGGLIVRHGRAVDEIPALARQLGVAAVHVNRDYEPGAKERDATVRGSLATDGITFHDWKDQAIFDRGEVLTRDGSPFSVFTPYKAAWLKRLTDADLTSRHGAGHLAAVPPTPLPGLGDLGFESTDLADIGVWPGMSGARALWSHFQTHGLAHYAAQRDRPGVHGVSCLSVHLRFGTVSPRELVRTALRAQADTWLNELIWRDFYFMILDHHPRITGQAFKPVYEAVRWKDDPTALAAWQAGRTGYPLVDAGMRQLLACGWMHNRLRMLTASFLTKDLGVDWRRGEQHFADWLLDFDLSANNGGWQWAASTGCDAQPYFRIFNPVTQSREHDPEGEFIRRYVPELARVPPPAIHAPWTLPRARQEALGVVIGRDYPAPLVDHAAARAETLARYAVARAR